jgi:uncharacterized protein (TIGR03437 family)
VKLASGGARALPAPDRREAEVGLGDRRAAAISTACSKPSESVPAGQLFSTQAPITNSISVQVGGVSASVLFAGLVTPGLYQLNLTVPEVADGNQELTLRIGMVPSQNSAVLAVQH